jgi:hypothetical protein
VTDALNHVDLAFVVDTTSSMGTFIAAARQQMIAMLEALTSSASLPIDLRLGVVEYRDHPPQDRSFAARTHDFVADMKKAQRVINGLTPAGGGDGPESVYDGVETACTQLSWRPHSRRVAVLVGDAPPHGTGCHGDGFPRGCPCGLTAQQVTARCEHKGITLYALGLTALVKHSFATLATFTGGEFFEAQRGNDAIAALQKLLNAEFDGIELDRRVLEACGRLPAWTLDDLSTALDSTRGRVATSLSRLGRRGFLVETAP